MSGNLSTTMIWPSWPGGNIAFLTQAAPHSSANFWNRKKWPKNIFYWHRVNNVVMATASAPTKN